jgi:hypothetical protein
VSSTVGAKLAPSSSTGVYAGRRGDWLPLSLGLIPGIAFMLLFLWRAGSNPWGSRRFTLFDDAMISMSYARTLVDSGELVWFPGAPRVQGITNPLWTGYMSVIHLVGLDGSAAALVVGLTGMVLVVVAAVLVFLLVRRTLGGGDDARGFSVVAAGVMPFLYPFTFWSLRGMEVPLLAVLLLAMVFAVPLDRRCGAADERGRLAIAAGAAALGVFTRLDFAAVAVVVVAWSVWWGGRKTCPDRTVDHSGWNCRSVGAGHVVCSTGVLG